MDSTGEPKKKSGAKDIAIGAGVLAAVFIAVCACGDTSDSASTGAATSTTNHVPTAEELKHDPSFQETFFISELNQKQIPYSSEDAAVNLAHKTCDMFDAGSTGLEVVSTMMASNDGYYTNDQLSQVLGLSVATYCDQYQPKLEGN